MPNNVRDLRSALEFLATIPGQLVSTRAPVDPNAELGRRLQTRGRGNAARSTDPHRPRMRRREGQGLRHAGSRRILASRERTALLMNSTIEAAALRFARALKHPCPPVTVTGAACQEVGDPAPFDVRRLIPAPTHTVLDAGRTSTWACSAPGPRTGESDVTITGCACRAGPAERSISSPAGTSTSSA